MPLLDSRNQRTRPRWRRCAGSTTPRTSTKPSSRSRPSRPTSPPSSPRRRQDHRRSRDVAGVLQVPHRALDPFANDQSDRKHFRDRTTADQSDQRAGIPRGRSGHGLQADRRRAGPLEGRQRPTPGRPGACAGAVSHKGKLLERPTDITTPPPPSDEDQPRNGRRLKHPDPQVLTIPAQRGDRRVAFHIAQVPGHLLVQRGLEHRIVNGN